MGRKLDVQGIVNKYFDFFPSNFPPPSKWRPWHVPCLPYPRYATASNIVAFCRYHITRGGQLVFDWDRLENFLITRDRPVGNKVTNTICHKIQRFSCK